MTSRNGGRVHLIIFLQGNRLALPALPQSRFSNVIQKRFVPPLPPLAWLATRLRKAGMFQSVSMVPTDVVSTARVEVCRVCEKQLHVRDASELRSHLIQEHTASVAKAISGAGKDPVLVWVRRCCVDEVREVVRGMSCFAGAGFDDW